MFPSCANNLWRMVHDRDPPGIVCHLVIAGEAYLLSAASRAYQNGVRGGRGTAQGPRRCPPEGGCGCMEKRKRRSHGRWIGRQTRATRATGESNCDGAARRQMIPDQREHPTKSAAHTDRMPRCRQERLSTSTRRTGRAPEFRLQTAFRRSPLLFYEGPLQTGIALAVKEAKPVLCFIWSSYQPTSDPPHRADHIADGVGLQYR